MVGQREWRPQCAPRRVPSLPPAGRGGACNVPAFSGGSWGGRVGASLRGVTVCSGFAELGSGDSPARRPGRQVCLRAAARLQPPHLGPAHPGAQPVSAAPARVGQQGALGTAVPAAVSAPLATPRRAHPPKQGPTTPASARSQLGHGRSVRSPRIPACLPSGVTGGLPLAAAPLGWPLSDRPAAAVRPGSGCASGGGSECSGPGRLATLWVALAVGLNPQGSEAGARSGLRGWVLVRPPSWASRPASLLCPQAGDGGRGRLASPPLLTRALICTHGPHLHLPLVGGRDFHIWWGQGAVRSTICLGS